ncbi:RecT family recombinase [Bifidobacterium xylocopae]|uniref:Phage recombination protein Bet n=1 Tax=Bifidobacterium xylocopae TaxID=2493119 RepID=A0A366KEC4_9BIFI|nr:RecT family recombinase [Bifidobacterium xylocopae]RBQ00045.1 hypothetical protein CRD59_00860 [Bifidobacterium xylocopae]
MSSDLTITEKQDGFTQNQVAALRQMGVQNASQGDLAVFFHQVQRTGLDPFARQIYMISRAGKQTIQTGIDGFRLIARRAAERSHETFGEPETVWCGEDGRWRDVWLDPQNPPVASKVVVQRGQGTFVGVATLAEYVGRKKDGSLTSMWASKPAVMLSKCAEALALRKAFPQDLSGLYTADEMQDDEARQQSSTAAGHENHVRVDVMAPKEQQQEIAALMKQGGVSSSAQAGRAFGVLVGKQLTSTSQLTLADAETLLSAPELVVSRTREALAGEVSA